jgi:hypothetical protein
MSLGHTVLFSEMSPPRELENEFNTWYDREHIPLRMTVPGFVSAQRYLAEDDQRNYLAVYEMSESSNLKSPEYLKIKNEPSDLTKKMLGSVSGFTRYIGNLLGEDWQTDMHQKLDEMHYIYAVFFTVPDDEKNEFDAWYSQDHVPILLECSDWIGTRRFEVIDGDPQKYNRMALHYLKTISALDSPARAKARTTPWRDRLAVKPWFKGHYLVFKACRSRQLAKN